MGLHLLRRAPLSVGILLVFTTSAAIARPPVQLRTGASSAANGYLEIRPDDYGAWAADFVTGAIGPNGDSFKPSTSTLQVVSFTNGFMLFAPGAQRELLTDNAQWQAATNGTGGPPFSADTSLSRSVTSANVASDSNGDGINDTANSGFRIFAPGGGTDLGFLLSQRVTSISPSVSNMVQTYRVTNNGAAPITFKMVRGVDADLLWDANFESDSVGTSANGAGLGPFVFEQEPAQPTQSLTLSIPNGASYYGGKHGVLPGLGAPVYDFGTDTEVWDANGIPTSWINNVAGVGYAPLNGQSGPAPVGSTVPRDAFMGVDILLTLGVGASASFDVFQTYGQTTPIIPEPGTIGLLAFAALATLRRRRF